MEVDLSWISNTVQGVQKQLVPKTTPAGQFQLGLVKAFTALPGHIADVWEARQKEGVRGARKRKTSLHDNIQCPRGKEEKQKRLEETRSSRWMMGKPLVDLTQRLRLPLQVRTTRCHSRRGEELPPAHCGPVWSLESAKRNEQLS